ncbi:MAG: GNAT family N-acetyltransferase [Oscillospiraceae bacterium]
MNKIIYREIKKQDYNAIQSIINQSFGLYRYVDHPKALATLLKLYLQSCLSEQTFSCVAEKDGEVVGVILGNAKSDFKVVAHLKHMLLTTLLGIKMVAQSFLYKCSTTGYRKLHAIYHDFLKDKKSEFDGVLTLFAVNETCRGFGVGKELLSNFLNYLQKHNTKHIYLYTDSTCNYGFYDSQGFEQLEKRVLTMTCEQQPMEMDVFLYGYKIK